MKVQSFKSFSPINNRQYSSNPRQSIPYKVSFTSNSGKIAKSTMERLAPSIEVLKQRFLTAIEEVQQKKTYSNISEELGALAKRNLNLVGINEEYRIFNKQINDILKNAVPEQAKKMAQWIDDTRTLEQENKGFKRVFGYQKIKQDLKQKFALETIMVDRVMGGVKVPNAIAIFGLPNNGKSLFVKALTEHSHSAFKEVNIGEMVNDEFETGIPAERAAMDTIKKLAKWSLQNHVDNDGQRTIMLVNEADAIADSKSPVFEEFSRFIQTCSERYKCTLALTSNNIQSFDKSILSNDITPLKIGLPPADRETCKEVFQGVLEPLGKMPSEGMDLLVNEFFKSHDKVYSNAGIIDVINSTLQTLNGKTPLVKDYLDTIKKGYIRPSIPKAEVETFYEQKRLYESNSN